MSEDDKSMALAIQKVNLELERQNDFLQRHMVEDEKTNKIHLDILQRVSDQMQDTQECVMKLDKKLDLSIQKMSYELGKINTLDEQQNKLIDEHIDGVETLKDLYELHKKESNERLQKLEEPRIVRKTLIKWIVTTGSVAGAIYAIGKVAGWF